MSEDSILSRISQAIMDGDRDLAHATAEEALDAGLDPLDVIQQGTSKAMQVVGQRFRDFEIFLPELVLSADAANAAMAVLLPQIAAERRSDAVTGRVVIGTVSGDMHDIGKNLVAAVLAAEGFEVSDLGIDVPAKRFVSAARDLDADIIALSSLLTTSMQYQKDVIDYLADTGCRGDFFVIVGGGPVTAEWAAKISADGCGRRASEAAELCRLLLKDGREPATSSPIAIGM